MRRPWYRRLGTGLRRLAAAVWRRLVRRFLPRRSRRPVHRLRATPAEEDRLRAALAAGLVPARTTGPRISIVVVTRNGRAHLERLLPALADQAWEDLELVLVDNGSSDGTVAWARSLSLRYPIRLVANAENRSFSEANNQGVAAATGELLLLLNNDTEPAGRHVVGHMAARLLADDGTVGIAARLVYPRRSGPTTGPLHRAPDLTLQHRGVAFATEDGVPVARNLGAGEDPLGEAASAPRTVPAATAAALMVRRRDFEAVGGFSAGYDYGQEDVDLCLKLRARGGRFRYEPQATFFHHESASQHREARDGMAERRRANRRLLLDRWGPTLAREVLLDRLTGAGGWAAGPPHVGLTVTSEDPGAGYGDWHTAHELGDALAALGWQVSYLERRRGRWYRPVRSLDVVIVLVDAFDIRRLPDGVVTIAWIRNWTDRWLGHAWFDDYDLVLTSSEVSRVCVERGSAQVAQVMPIATNPDRFRPRPTGPHAPAPSADVVFAGNRWGEERNVERVLHRLRDEGRRVRVHGRRWHAVGLGGLGGPLPYEALPAVYASAAIVLDDAAGPTRPYGSINARVFDALATGTLVITDNPAGTSELFGDRLPGAADPDALADLVDRWLADPAGRERRAAELQAIVLARHTYAHRAVQVRDALVTWAGRSHVDIAVGAPAGDAARRWGDYHFGRGFQRALRRAGWAARLRTRPAWDAPSSARADVVVHLFGLRDRRRRPAQVNVLWILSHPDRVDDGLLEGQDLVLVASTSFADRLRGRASAPVHVFHQATDPERFTPTPGGPPHQLLFVGNSRNVRRETVEVLSRAGRDLVVYGSGWSADLLDPAHLRGDHVPNEELAAWYGAAAIVLNDTWPDMAAHGFLSNRLFDAAAAGAFVISDRVAGIDAVFDGGIVTWGSPDELLALVDRYLAEPAARSRLAARARAAVLAGHTFAHRAEAFGALVTPLLPARSDPPGTPEAVA